jgi:hypothetical protein
MQGFLCSEHAKRRHGDQYRFQAGLYLAASEGRFDATNLSQKCSLFDRALIALTINSLATSVT